MQPRGYKVTHEKLGRMAYGTDPADIQFQGGSASRYLKGSFGKAEVDTNAARLVRFFQLRREWCSFSYEELQHFAKADSNPDIFGDGLLFGLADDWHDDAGCYEVDYLRLRPDGKIWVTDIFILWCADRSAEVRKVLYPEAA